MIRHAITLFALLALFLASVALPGAKPDQIALAQAATATPAAEEEEAEPTEAVEELEPQLVTATVKADLVRPGRVLMSARGNHWIYDSVPPIKGPNEEVNPLDALVGALPACGVMIYEAAARENEIPLRAIDATVEADLDPRGVAGANVNPRIRAFRVTLNVDGPTLEEAEFLAAEYSARCPIYATLERSAPIEVTNVLMDQE